MPGGGVYRDFRSLASWGEGGGEGSGVIYDLVINKDA